MHRACTCNNEVFYSRKGGLATRLSRGPVFAARETCSKSNGKATYNESRDKCNLVPMGMKLSSSVINVRTGNECHKNGKWRGGGARCLA